MFIAKFLLCKDWWLVVSATIYILLLLIWFGRFAGKERICLTACLIFGAIYYMAYDLTNQTHFERMDPGEVELYGEVLSVRKLASGAWQYELKEQEEKLLLRMMPKTYADHQVATQLKPGTKIKFRAELAQPEQARSPGSFDYRQYLYHKRIHWIAEPTAISDMKIVSASRFSPIAILASWQAYLSCVIEATFPADLATLMKGLLMGEQTVVDPTTADVYKQLGISHVLAISGLHMVVLSAFIQLVLQLLGLSKETTLLITVIMIPLYVFLAGASPSILRSGIMSVIVMLGTYHKRNIDSLNIWGAALLLLLFWDPYQLWDVGFELSFGCVWGLITFSSRIAQKLGLLGPHLAAVFSVDIAAQLTSYPLTIFYFHHYFLLSMFINLLVVPLYSLLFIPGGFLCLVLGMIHPGLGFLISQSLAFLYKEMSTILIYVSEWSWADLFIAEPSVLWIIGYYLVLVHGLWIIKDRLGLWFVIHIVFILWSMLPPFDRDQVTVTFLDVGQGDAIVVESKTKTMLIDAGGINLASGVMKDSTANRWDAGRGVIIPFLQWKGINHLDYVVGTHGDLDHIGGMSSLIRKVPVKLFLRNGKLPTTTEEKELLNLLGDRQIPTQSLERGWTWQDGPDVKWLVLHAANSDSNGSDNNNSVVLLLEAYGYRFLFTGDLERAGESDILHQQPPLLPRPINVLKVGHHGSRSSTSDEWVIRIKPTISVISVGKRNRYGHPHLETLETLEREASLIYRTDQQGAITIEVNRDGMKAFTSLQQK